MKILIATQCRSIIGGVETYLQGVIPALLKRGHELALLCDYPGPSGAATIDPPDARLPIWYSDELRTDAERARKLAMWDPTVIYSQAAIDLDASLLRKYPTVLYVHGYYGTCTTGQKCHTFPSTQACTRKFGPMCLVLHYPRRCGGLNPFSALRMYREQRNRNQELPNYRAVLVASTHMYSELQNHGVKPEKLHLVRLPLTEPGGSSEPGPKTPGGRLLFVGRLTNVKGVDFLVRAVPLAESKLGRKLRLTVAGDGAQMQDLQQLARREGIDVEFTGWLDNDRKLEYMRESDLLVVPSLWPEPFGLVGIEAGSVGLPAAGFAAGGIPDWLIPGETGELASSTPPTVEGLADAIVRALADDAHNARLREGALEFSKRFTVDQHVDALEAILRDSVAARPPAVLAAF